MKKLFFFVLLLLFLSLYPFLERNYKLTVYRAIHEPIVNLSRSNPSFFLKRKLLNFKISRLPPWAKEQIAQDLVPFTKISSSHLKKIFHENDIPSNKLVYVTIKNKQVKFTTNDNSLQYSRAYKVMFDTFRFLAKYNYVPNTEFILCLEDYLKVNNSKSKPIPIFTFSKDTNSVINKSLLLIPDWMNLRGWPKLRSKIKYANSLYKWEDKEDLLFWRGGLADSTGFRLRFVKLALQHPTLINAGIVGQKDEWRKVCPEEKDSVISTQYLNDRQRLVQPEKHLKYKYQMSIDGACCTWERLVWQLHSNSLLFKYESSQKQWFHKGIQPFIHYLPVFSEEDLLLKLEWAKKHEKNVLSIINNANIFAKNNLEIEDMFAYIAFLINQYTQRLDL